MRNMEIPRCYSQGITASCGSITDADAGTMSNENDRAKLKAEIDALRDYDPERLRRRYQELTGVDAPPSVRGSSNAGAPIVFRSLR